MSAPEWISAKEAAELSGYNLKYLRRVVQHGKIRAEKKGGHDWWIDKASLQAYIKQMKTLGNEKFNPFRDQKLPTES